MAIGFVFMAGGIGLFALALLMFWDDKPIFSLLSISGFVLFISGVKLLQTERKKEIDGSTRAKVDRLADEKRAPSKVCPNCVKEIVLNAKVCPFCNYHYPIIYTLTVFKPMDQKKTDILIKKLVEITGKTGQEIGFQLESGMLFKYSDMDLCNKNKKIFEILGCIVKAREILGE